MNDFLNGVDFMIDVNFQESYDTQKYHKTRCGSLVLVSGMKNKHLSNTIKMFEKGLRNNKYHGRRQLEVQRSLSRMYEEINIREENEILNEIYYYMADYAD